MFRQKTDEERAAHAEYMRAWRVSRAEEINARRREAYAADSATTKARVKAYREANAEKVRAYRAEHRERRTAYFREWRAANRERNAATNHRRRAREAAAAGVDYTTAEKIRARWDMWGGKCRYCGAEATCTDHRIPLARGGSHYPANLVPACGPCNNRKYTMTEREFLAAFV